MIERTEGTGTATTGTIVIGEMAIALHGTSAPSEALVGTMEAAFASQTEVGTRHRAPEVLAAGASRRTHVVAKAGTKRLVPPGETGMGRQMAIMSV